VGGKEGERAGVRLFANVEFDMHTCIHTSIPPCLSLSSLSPLLPPFLPSSQVPWFEAWSTRDISSRPPVREGGRERGIDRGERARDEDGSCSCCHPEVEGVEEGRDGGRGGRFILTPLTRAIPRCDYGCGFFRIALLLGGRFKIGKRTGGKEGEREGR